MGNLHVAGPGDEKEMEERILEKLARAKAIRKEDLAAAGYELSEEQLAEVEAQFAEEAVLGDLDVNDFAAKPKLAEAEKERRAALGKILIDTRGLTLKVIKEILDDEKLPSIHVSRAKLTPEEISYLDGMGLLEDDEFF